MKPNITIANGDDKDSLDVNHEDNVVRSLHRVIRGAVRILAVLMAGLILLGVADVVWVLYQKLLAPPVYLLSINDILATFGAFLAVLIAIEIFSNITLYLSENVIHVKIVMATALMAVARKVIIFDYDELGWEYVLATGVVVLALGVTYWMISRVDPPKAKAKAKGDRSTDEPPQALTLVKESQT